MRHISLEKLPLDKMEIEMFLQKLFALYLYVKLKHGHLRFISFTPVALDNSGFSAVLGTLVEHLVEDIGDGGLGKAGYDYLSGGLGVFFVEEFCEGAG